MNKNSWRKKTDANIVTISRLRKAIQEIDGIAIGLVGFSGSFKKNDRADAEEITQRILTKEIGSLVEAYHPTRVFLISGATNLGVPKIGYTISKQFGCQNVGVTADCAMRYRIADLDFLTVVGKRFGDESNAFVSAIHQLWVIGGGKQSMDECALAFGANIPIRVFQGIGGIADELQPEQFEAEYLDIDKQLANISN